MGAAVRITGLSMASGKLEIQPKKIQGKNFGEVLQQKKDLKTGAENKTADIYSEIQNMQKNLLNGKEFSGKDLIMYQIKAGQFNLRVELLSKVAEGMISSFRKFQNPQ